MRKEQISIQISSQLLKQVDRLAAVETMTRNIMFEVLIAEALNGRMLDQIERLTDEDLEGEALAEEIKRADALTGTGRGRPEQTDK